MEAVSYLQTGKFVVVYQALSFYKIEIQKNNNFLILHLAFSKIDLCSLQKFELFIFCAEHIKFYEILS